MHEFALVFDGAVEVAPVGRGQSDRKFNYLIGDAANHREGVGSFNAVWYENLYPGISLEMTGRRSGVKYNFHVAPGADWRVIRLRYEGIDGLTLKENGALEINIAEGWPPLSDGTPYIYQEVNGEKRTVAGQFTLLDSHIYGFDVTDNYDPTLPLVIDPEVEWSTYLGGTGADYGRGIAVDASGACFATGYTISSGWVSGGWDTSLGGNYDGYVVKLNAAGGHEWSSYLGGTQYDAGYGIAVDASGNCYVVGSTRSSGWTLTTPKSGLSDAYVVKLNSAGGHQWSICLGGTQDEFGYDIAVDSSGFCYVTGNTKSNNWVSGGWDTTYNGGSYGDGFVVKLNSAGEHQWSTYLGGTYSDYGYGIAVDSSGSCYVTGYTESSDWTSGGWNTTLTGGNGFVVKLSSAGAHEWSTYLGGAGYDAGYGIAVDASGACYATGATSSSGWTSGGWDTTLNDGISTSSDGYVVKLNSAGEHQWSTYVGGTDADYGRGITMDGSGSCYVTGYTSSVLWTVGGWGAGQNGGIDGYVAKLSGDGVHLWSSCLGGTGDDYGQDIAVDVAGARVWVTGYTTSSGWVVNGWQTTYGGGTDAFVTKISVPHEVGNLQVIISPAEAIAAGAQWRLITTDSWLNSGDTVTGIAAGIWAVEFKNIGYGMKPEVQMVSVPAGGTATVSGVYILSAPCDISWSTYLGGTGSDYGTDIAVDSSGGCYAAGYTNSSGWVSGGGTTSLMGGYDGYVVKLNSAGAHEWSTYVGGTAYDNLVNIAVDSSGACYVSGTSDSQGYLAKLNSMGQLEWSSGSSIGSLERASYIALDINDNCYRTNYSWIFNTYPQRYRAGISKYDSAGTQCLITSQADIYYYGIAVDTSGSVYAVGQYGDYTGLGVCFLKKYIGLSA